MGGGKANNWTLDKGDLVMVLDVMVRRGSNGYCMKGLAFTGADAPDSDPAAVLIGGNFLPRSNGFVVCVRPSADIGDLVDLLNSGHAVQIRRGPWITEV